MSIFSKSFLRSIFVSLSIVICGGALLFFVNYSYFINYIYSPGTAGVDAIWHLMASQYYSEHIFPAVWGMADKWFFGMPFPQFYPPLFYFLNAIFFRVSGLDFDLSFRLLTVLSVIAIPGLTGIICRKISKTPVSWIICMFFSILFLSTFSKDMFLNFGVNILSTFDVGMVTHALAFTVFLLWLIFFLGIWKKNINIYLSVCLLSVLSISSVHIMPAAIFSIVISFFLDIFVFKRDNKIRVCFIYFCLSIIPLLITACWYLPMVARYDYLATQSLGTLGIGVKGVTEYIKFFWFMIIVDTGVLFAAIRNKDRGLLVVALTTLVMFLPASLRFDKYIPWFPIHTYRLIPVFYLLSPILIGYAFKRVFYKSRYGWFFLLSFVFLSILSINRWGEGLSRSMNFVNFYDMKGISGRETIVDFVSKSDARYVTEYVNTSREMNYEIFEKTIKIGSQTDNPYHVFCDSSISCLFFLPIKNIISQSKEPAAVSSWISWDGNKTVNLIRNRMTLLSFMGVDYFLVKTDKMRDLLQSIQNLSLAKSTKDWQVFYNKNAIDPISSPVKFAPVMLLSEINFKNKNIDSYDYLRVNQQAINDDLLDLTLVTPSDIRIDNIKDINRFESIFITDFKYENEDDAFNILTDFLARKQVFAIEDDNRLFNRINNLNSDNFITYPRIKDSKTIYAINNQIISILRELDDRKVRYPDQETNLKVTYSNGVFVLSGERSGLPVIIKRTFFPDWRSVRGSDIYMSTLGFMFLFAESDDVIYFDTPVSVFVGYGLSCFGILSFLILIIFNEKRKI